METIATATEERSSDKALANGPIVVATDGMKQSEGALAAALSLAAGMGSDVHVVAVQPPVGLIVPEAPLLLDPDVTPRLTSELGDRVRLQCADVSGETGGPPLPDPEVLNGDPERVITRIAREIKAQLIVVGLGRHDVMDRIFGTETALKVARLSRVPVLAIPTSFRGALHRAVVGLDFSDASLRAAQSALHLLASSGVLLLVHVIPIEQALLDPWMSEREYDDLLRHRFARFRARLTAPPNVTIEEYTCTGNAAKELITYADRQKADFIAAGSHGHGFVSRLVVGSVTTALLRAAKGAVLVVPPESVALGTGSLLNGGDTIHIEASQWSTILDDFTRTNVGRRTRLEVDDPDVGAQAQETDYPLRGIAFDPHDQRLEIMLGALGSGAPHLSRSISDVSALDVLVDNDGNDAALRVRHGTGQTMLTFPSP